MGWEGMGMAFPRFFHIGFENMYFVFTYPVHSSRLRTNE